MQYPNHDILYITFSAFVLSNTATARIPPETEELNKQCDVVTYPHPLEITEFRNAAVHLFTDMKRHEHISDRSLLFDRSASH